MPRVSPQAVLRSCLAAFLFAATTLLAGCAEPPNKEINQAQGAIDAARAAGAGQYASDELAAAVAALNQATEAVADGDYRLALANALNSREQAQNAAKAAVDARATARGDAERMLAEAVALVERADARLKTPAIARLPRRTLTPVEKVVASASASLQEARTALKQEAYPQVADITTRVTADVQAALQTLDAATPPAAPARRR